MSPPHLGVSLRPFPYPFRAALAMCSDIDRCDRRTFLEVHRFLNDPRQGLGLPVADSFFALGREPGQLAYFLPDGQTPGPDAGLIIQAIQGGLIDSLHSWGDFNDNPPEPEPLRRSAHILLEHLQNLGLSVKVWINHGSPANLQNLQTRLRPDFQGDDPHSPWYTADLARSLGVKFYWWMELAPWPLSGRRTRFSPRLWARLGVNAAKNLVKLITGHGHRRRTGAELTDLCRPVRLRDGQPLMAFTRFNRHLQGLWGRPTRHTLRYALSPRVLAELRRDEGFTILYTHLGLPQPASAPLFAAPDLQALENLADTFHSGDIWVAPTAQVLTYWLVRQYLTWQVSRTEGKIIIDLVSLNDPLTGPRLPEEGELAGVTFYSPRPQSTVIRLAGRDLPSLRFPPDHRGESSLGLPPPPPPSVDGLED